MTADALVARASTWFSIRLGAALGSLALASLAPVRPWGWQGGSSLAYAGFFLALAFIRFRVRDQPRPRACWPIIAAAAIGLVAFVKGGPAWPRKYGVSPLAHDANADQPTQA
jgi:hypothetical protein